ncbi:lipoprotein LpqH [Mycobacterium sp. 1274756.6]|uniref:lipoprotein LpqH n=1 Tax=Mycobacterium sp. 1274756.6 TaxID=1834076 RepID=UPI0007FC20C2|nr:lipoprotein LpqH [Mycobacterium sp. 1274756.6]OBJ68081.1 hypothetical protein A5643_15080 [Mycobacterium sp. 1274756.6]
MTAAVLWAGCATGCSPTAPEVEDASPPRGEAVVTVDGIEMSSVDSARCSAVGPYTTIVTGDGTVGMTVMISTAEEPTIEFVDINNLAGFTGGYNRDLEGDAVVTVSGPTYDIRGTALGYDSRFPERTSRTFQVQASC